MKTRLSIRGIMIAALLVAIFTITYRPYLAALLAPEEAKTLPTPYYLQDDIQYFPAGPGQKLSKEAEAAELEKVRAEAEKARDGQNAGS